MNAINDALAPFEVAAHSQPITPQKILRALGKVYRPDYPSEAIRYRW